jgi:hypothetical protein
MRHLASLAFVLIFRDLLNETQAQSQFATVIDDAADFLAVGCVFAFANVNTNECIVFSFLSTAIGSPHKPGLTS